MLLQHQLGLHAFTAVPPPGTYADVSYNSFIDRRATDTGEDPYTEGARLMQTDAAWALLCAVAFQSPYRLSSRLRTTGTTVLELQLEAGSNVTRRFHVKQDPEPYRSRLMNAESGASVYAWLSTAHEVEVQTVAVSAAAGRWAPLRK